MSNDPAERKGIQLSEQQKNFLISKGPYQPVLENYLCSNVISKSKQNSFSAKWLDTFPYLEYSPSLDRAYCFAAVYLVMGQDQKVQKPTGQTMVSIVGTR